MDDYWFTSIGVRVVPRRPDGHLEYRRIGWPHGEAQPSGRGIPDVRQRNSRIFGRRLSVGDIVVESGPLGIVSFVRSRTLGSSSRSAYWGPPTTREENPGNILGRGTIRNDFVSGPHRSNDICSKLSDKLRTQLNPI